MITCHHFHRRVMTESRNRGKSALVTGGTKGIGLAIAQSLADRGAGLFICARNSKEVERTVSVLRAKYGKRVAGTACDVRNYDQVREMIAEAEQALGGLDILVNNA